MLQTMGMKPQLVVKKEIKMYITAEEYKAMYKALPERTSSSPSDRHVGTYKAFTKSESLSGLLADMISYPWVEDFPPKDGK